MSNIPDLAAACRRLRAHADSIDALCRRLAPTEAGWKQSPQSWSIVEIVNHLADEEAEDFRARLERVLRDPAEDWPRIDPEKWAVERRYGERELAPSLDRFLAERERSLAWLPTLGAANWGNKRHHHAMGDLGAEDLLASWLAHDLLHVRQITRVLYYMPSPAPGGKPVYAGAW